MHTLFVILLCILGHSVNATTTLGRFHDDCNKFFYRFSAPTGFNSQTNRYICQRYEGDFYFATLYDTFYRIPLYSAYKITEFNCAERQPSRKTSWFIEPQLEGGQQEDMDTDKIENRGNGPTVQALNSDYSNTGFDRGHLNPNFHHCGSARVATFTLTNSIPQDPCFNRIAWYDIEQHTKKNMETYCQYWNAQRYVIVGAIPSETEWIPSEDDITDDDRGRPTERVNVPDYSWTLSCCASGNIGKWWTGILGENKAGGYVEEFTDLTDMERRLSELYGTSIELLKYSCGPNLDSLVG